MRAEHFGALGFIRKKVIHLFRGAVVSDDGEAVVVHVENQILTHDGQTDKGNVSLRFHKILKPTIQNRRSPASKINPCQMKKFNGTASLVHNRPFKIER